MRISRASIMTAVAAMMVIGVAACNPGDNPTPTPTPTSDATTTTPSATPTPTPTPTPSPTPTPTSTPTTAEAAAKQAVLDYYEVYNKVAMDPKGDPNDFADVTAGELREVSVATFKSWRAKGWHATAPVKVRNLRIGVVTTKDGVAAVQATSCGVVKDVDVVDEEGKSQVVDDRPDYLSKVMWLEKKAGSDRWVVIRSRDGGNACDE